MAMFKSPGWAALIDVKTADGVVSAVSRARLTAYGIGITGSVPVDVVARHGRNITLCEAMYPVLHLLEIVLRNSVHNAFSAHYANPNWYDETWLNPGHQKLVKDAKQELKKRGKSTDPDRVVAELGFGFWCGMFHHSYETGLGPWPALLQTVLPRVPKSWRTRKKISERLEDARAMRNRVFHHEPIMNYSDLLQRYRAMVEVLGWFSPEARNHLEHLSRFSAVSMDRLELEPVAAQANAEPAP